MLTVSLMLTFLTSCATTGLSEFCRVAEPIYLDAEDQLTIETQRAILSHNLTGRQLCDW